MEWLVDSGNVGLIVIRSTHFAATATMAGALIFRFVVAEPSLLSAEVSPPIVRKQTLRVAWISLAIAAVSGVIWFLLQVAAMSDLPFDEALTIDVLLTVANETQFGLVSEIRFTLAIVLATCLTYGRYPWTRWPTLVSGLGLIAAIAWTGHAGSTVGTTGLLHLATDALHLVASAAWIGGVLPLALLLAVARHHSDRVWASIAQTATRRFSTLAIVSVVTLLATGMFNAWILVGSLRALIATEYGRLLMLKISLFAIMLVIAAANRFYFTPQLALPMGGEKQLGALRQLTQNSLIEIALGLAIFAIVGALGTLHPAIHVAKLPI